MAVATSARDHQDDEHEKQARLAEGVADINLNSPTDTSTGKICPPEKAALIRKQVDYYFSDVNLQHDKYLQRKMKGSKNAAFPLKDVAGFKKMQPFQPIEHIYDALVSSTSVNVSVNNAAVMCIQRKVPFHQEKQKASPAGPVVAKGKEATGFEQYFAEPPLTPDVAAEERALYSSDNPVADRLEAAVKRYKSRRKMDSFVLPMFLKWMAFGGMFVGSAPFQGGMDPADRAEMTSRQKKEVNIHVHALGAATKDDGTEIWEVGFAAVARAFLSRRIWEFSELDNTVDIDKVVNIMLNFYRYLQLHDVCPEYNDDIQLAKGVCEAAAIELPKIVHLNRKLPGCFNIAASTVFGGQWASLWAGDKPWGKLEDGTMSTLGMSRPNALSYLSTVFSSLGLNKPTPNDSNMAFDRASLEKQKVIRKYADVGLRVEMIQPPTDGMKRWFDEETCELLKRLGLPADPPMMLLCEPCEIPDFNTWDLPAGVSSSGIAPGKKFQLLLESSMLDDFMVNMKFQATVYQLESGIYFFEQVTQVRPTFDMALSNELVLGYKEPHFFTAEEMAERDGQLVRKGRNPDSESEDDET